MTTQSTRSTTRQKVGAATTLTIVGGSIVMNGTQVQALSPVVTTLDDNLDGGDGQTSLREALYAVNGQLGSHTITFAPGLSGVIDLASYGQLNIPDENLTLTGPGSDQITLRNTGGNVLYVYGTSQTQTISGLTLADAGTHGISVREAGTVFFDDIVITNSTDAGLNVSYGGNVMLSNSTISGSGADGIQLVGTNTLGNTDAITLDNVVLDANAAEGLDATVVDSVTITDTTISNHANGTGVVMVGNATSSTLDIERSTISGNTSATVSGVSVYKGNTDIVNSTVSGNDGPTTMFFKTGDVNIDHSTLSGNTGTGTVIGLLGSANDAVLDHTIVSANGSLGVIDVGNAGVQRANWSLLGTDVTTEFNDPASGDNVATDDPKLGALTDNGGPTPTMLPATDSPALEGGDATVTGQPTTDQTGLARVAGTIDVGSVEREINGLEVTTLDGPANDGETSLTEAIVVANSNVDASVVTFAAGLTGTIALDSSATVTTDTTIAGPGATDITITATSNDAIVLDGSSVDLTVSDLTIANSSRGIVNASGATGTITVTDSAVTGSTIQGIVADGLTSLTVTDSNVSNNLGTGIAAVDTQATITRTTIADNGATAPIGSGIRFEGSGGGLVDDSTITGNSAPHGGGIRVEDGSLTVRSSTISQNDASTANAIFFDDDKGKAGGIGVFNGSGAIVIEDSTIAGNSADVSNAGVALFGNAAASPTLTITESTVSGNTTTGAQGGVVATNADVDITSSTIADNSAASGASGVGVEDGSLDIVHSTVSGNTTAGTAVGVGTATSNISLDHTIVAGNANDDFLDTDGGGTETASFSLIGNGSLSEFTGANNTGTADPLLGALADNGGTTETMLPAAGSPAIDAGDPAIVGAPATDQRGAARIVDTIDVGSVEVPEVLDPGVIDISPVTISVDEEITTMTLTVTRSGGSLGLASVDVATAFGTATSADLTALNTTVSWADGVDGAQTVSIDITSDSDIEPDETFTVDLSNFVGAIAGTDITSTVTILDNDEVGAINISPATLSVDESGTSATLTVSRTGGTDGAASATVATTNGTATAGSDFTAVNSVVSWADGESDDKTVVVAITDDTDIEADESFTVDLSGITGAAAGATTSSAVTIVDDDEVGVIDISPATVSVDETGTMATVTVTRSGGSDGAASVNVATADDSATAGDDYTAVTTTLNWADGVDGAQTVDILISDDTDIEGDELFDVVLSAFVGATAGSVTTTNVTIVDDENAGTIDIAPATVSIAEDGGTATLTVSRTGGSDGAASVNVATANGSATAGDDYTAVTTTLNWADGESDDKVVSVPIIDDPTQEGDETFTVDLSTFVGAAAGTTTSSTVTIDANDVPIPVPGVVDIAPATISVDEDGTSVSLTVTRSGGSDGAVSVDVDTIVGTATAGDFTAVDSTLTWADGVAGDQTVIVPITDDATLEADEDFTVVLSNPSVVALGSSTSSTVTIIDNDDVGVINLTPATIDVDETGTSVTLTAIRSAGSDGAASASVGITNGSATLGSDFTAPAATVSWADGELGAKSIIIPITDDALVEIDETFGVDLSNFIGATSGPLTTSTVTIIDDEVPGEINLAAGTLDVDETAGNATITLTRSGGSDGIATATITTSNGTATEGSDFTEPATVVTWPAGDTTDKTIDIPILDDGDAEVDETFTVNLGTVTVATAGTNNSQTVTIIDNDDVGTISISPATVSVNENVGTVDLTVTRSGGSDGAASVSVDTANGTAGAGDYAPVSTSFNWAEGEVGSRTVTVTITDDATQEGDESFSVDLSGFVGAAAGATTSSTVTITANDAPLPEPGVVDISPATVSVDEDGASASLTVTRSGGSDGAVSVDVDSITGTAGAADYTAVNSTLTWADGVAGDQTVAIAITDDAAIEADEQFTVELSNPSVVALGTTTTSTVTIVDNDDVGVINLAPATADVNEDGTSIVLTATRSGGSDGAASATVGTVDGTATAGADYTAPPSTVSWADGEVGPKTITVNITDDALVEADETFSVELSDFVGAAGGTADSSAITIIDDENGGEINLASSTVTVDESDANAVITLTRSGGSDGVATAQIVTTDGTATEGSDFTEPATVVTWPAGDTTDKTINIPIVDDGLVETDETFAVELANVTTAAEGTADSATVTIIDNDDVGTIHISPATVDVAEDGVSVDLTVTRSGGSDGAAAVDVKTAIGSAGAADFTAVDTTLDWVDGVQGPQTATVFISNDGLPEGDETFTVDLSGFVGAIAGATTTSTVTILDDEDAGMISISPATMSVEEDGTSAVFTLSRNGGSDGAVSVDVDTADGTAGSADYSPVATTVNWADGDAADKTVVVTITDDAIVEDDETFDVVLSNFSIVGAGSATSSTVTIVDNDDVGTIAISPATVDVGESAAFATLTVTRSGGSDGAASVRVTTVDGSAGSADYSAVDSVLTWADGQSGPKTVNVLITKDDLIESPETFSVELSEFTGSVAGATTASTVTILDDDGVGEVVLSPGDVVVDEDGEKVVFMVTRQNGSDGPASVRFSTSDGSAVAPDDYTALSLTASWLDGESGAKKISVPIIDDSIDDDNETFTAELSDAVGAVMGSASSSTVTIIDNDDPPVVEPEPEATPFVTSVTPARLVDTRSNGETTDDRYARIGAIKTGGTLRVNVVSRAGVPADAKAAVVNVTSVRGDGIGFLTVHPCLEEPPEASSLNFDGANTPNEIITGLSDLGQLCVFSSVETDVLMDVVGYVAGDSAYQPLAPARLLETRPGKKTVDGIAAGVGSLDAGETFELKVTGRAGVSADATAVVVNVTSIKAPSNGFITVHPCLPEEPGASSLNYTAGSNRANEVIAQVSDKGTICLFASTETGLLVDIVGELTDETDYTPVAPARLVDTRFVGTTIDGKQQQIGRQNDEAKLIVNVEGRADVPADADGVVVNITSVRPAGVGFFTTYDCGSVPNASSLNYAADTVANEIIVELNDAGNFCVFSARDTDLLIDVVGYL